MDEVPRFSIEQEEAPEGVRLLVLGGEIDLATSPRFRQLVEGAEGVRAVVADLGEVTFMDSTMLKELLRAHRELESAGARLVLARVQEPVQRLLDLTGTASLFEIAPSRQAALELAAA